VKLGQRERVLIALQAWFTKRDRPPSSVELADMAGLDSSNHARAWLTVLRRAGDVVGTRRSMRLAGHRQIDAAIPRFDLLAHREKLRAELAAVEHVLAERP